MLQQFSKKSKQQRISFLLSIFFFSFFVNLMWLSETKVSTQSSLRCFEPGWGGGQGFRRARARVRRASSGLSAVVSHWKGPNGGASQGSQDVVMEDGSVHIAATSLNLALMRYWARLMLAGVPVMVIWRSDDPSMALAILICAPDI